MNSKYDYYMHRSKGYVDDYFGSTGEPFKIALTTYHFMRLAGYRVTKAPKGTTLVEVKVIAAIKGGSDPNSYTVKKIREATQPKLCAYCKDKKKVSFHGSPWVCPECAGHKEYLK